MSYELNDFIADCSDAIDIEGKNYDLERIRQCAEKIAKNSTFVETFFGEEAEVGTHTLYQDNDKDFMILSHIKDTGFDSPPHDHGASWAVYCQIEKYVDMCEYKRQDGGAIEGKAELVQTNSYRLNPGQAGFFDAFEIHSISVPDKARFMRITGTDLSLLKTSRFDLDTQTVSTIVPNDSGDTAGGR